MHTITKVNSCHLSERYGIGCSANFLGLSPKTPGIPTDRPLIRHKMQVAQMARCVLSQQLPTGRRKIC